MICLYGFEVDTTNPPTIFNILQNMPYQHLNNDNHYNGDIVMHAKVWFVFLVDYFNVKTHDMEGNVFMGREI